MPKINVYLSDDLAEAVRRAEVPVSAVCQRALEQAVRRVTAIRETVVGDLDLEEPTGAMAYFTARARNVLRLAAEQAGAQGAPAIRTEHLLGGLLAEGDNLALRVLTAVEVEPDLVRAELRRATPAGSGAGGGATERAGAGDGAEHAGDGAGRAPAAPRRFDGPAANALEMTVSEATGLGHNYVGCEHLLLGLIAEPDGAAGRILRAQGAEFRLTRRAVAAALAGYVHLRGNIEQAKAGQGAAPGSTAATAALAEAVRKELHPLVERIERLERHAGLGAEG